MPLLLLWRNLLTHPIRSVLTVGSVGVAVFLICLLHAAVSGLSRTLEAAASNRLFVQSAVSLFVDLPLSYQQKLASVPGIEAICKWQWFGGRYEQEKGGFFAQFGIDPENFLPSYPELSIAEGSYEEFKARRNACIVGKDLMIRYGWKVGQTVPIMGTIFTRLDGSAWEFQIAGVYVSNTTAIDQQTMYFHFDYLREAIESGGARGPEGACPRESTSCSRTGRSACRRPPRRSSTASSSACWETCLRCCASWAAPCSSPSSSRSSTP